METEYYFNRLRADNIELFYEHNFNFWFVHNSSHTKFNEELLTGAMKDVRAVTNALGFREDKITTSKIDVSGFKIKEPEFIEYEKDKILSLLKDSTNSQLKRKLNHYLGFIQKKESQFETSQPHQIEENNTIKTPPPTKLSDIITHEKSVQIVEKIKVQYKNIKGKRLKLLLIALQDLELIPKETIASMFHRSCEEEFNWGIASYQAMNDYVFNEKIDLEEVESMKRNLKSIINDK